MATTVVGEIAIAAAERAAARPRKVADVTDLGVTEKVRANKIVAIPAIWNLLDNTDARTEGLAATAAVAAIPDMMRTPARRAAIEVGGVGRTRERHEQP